MLILHHKMISPFSEKIRLMLGYCELDWQSVITPLIPPRPSLDPILQGYRRIPVAQLGADYFCDTRLIADEISQIAARPSLSPATLHPEHLDLCERIDSEYFLHCLNSLSPWGVLRKVLREVPLGDVLPYLKDKKYLLAHRSPEAEKMITDRRSSLQIWLNYLHELERMIRGPFILGEQASYLDFCAFHMIWFRQSMHKDEAWVERPKLQHWYEHMRSLTHGNSKLLRAEQSIQAATQTARPIADHFLSSKHIGELVSIRSRDISVGPTQGTLVGEDSERWIIARHHPRVGTCHLHFSKASSYLASTDIQR